MATAPVRIPMRITQLFGKNPQIYKQFGLAGHNGLDIGTPTGTKLYAMLPGTYHLLSDLRSGKWYGYGAAWRMVTAATKAGLRQEWTFAHLQNRKKEFDNKVVKEGTLIAECDNTGFSTGPHLHIGLRILKNGQIQNYNNGYKGAIDPLPELKRIGFKFV